MTTEPITITPQDPRFLDLTVGNNQRYQAKPDEVRLVRGTAQAVHAVHDAVTGGKRLAVRSGGHCFEDFVVNPEVRVVLDMSPMNGVYFDHDHDAFVVEAGARLLEVYEQLYRGWGVTIPGGICYSVGAGGHVTGGGYGLLSRSLGLTVDHLHGVEVVVVDRDGTAHAVTATREDTGDLHDLWWAHTGGGGGNFGVVTRFLFRSPDAPPLVRPPHEVLVSAVSVPWDTVREPEFVRLLDGYGTWHHEQRAADSPGGPLASLLMLPHRCNGSIDMVAQIDAAAPDAAGVLDRYQRRLFGTRRLPPPRRLPWLQATRLLGTNAAILNDPTMRAEHKSAYVRAPLPPDQLRIAYHELTRSDVDNPHAMLVAFSYGGAIGNVEPSATATAQRDSIFKLIYQAFWPDQAGDATNIAWVRHFYRTMYADTGGVPVPNDRTDGCYINYPDADLSDPAQNTSTIPWHTLYYKDNYPRLQRTKARWDPTDTFRHAQSIRLP